MENQNQPKNENVILQMKILFKPMTGEISIEGPLNDKVMCYGILEQAKDVVRAFDPAKSITLPAMPNGKKLGIVN